MLLVLSVFIKFVNLKFINTRLVCNNMDPREQEGYDAFKSGLSHWDNPYDHAPGQALNLSAEAWKRGWHQAKADSEYDPAE
jgi:ribosome modulation factor